MKGTIWRAAFPLIAEGMRLAGVRVIAGPRQKGKTTALIEMAIKDPSAIVLCPTREMVASAEQIYHANFPAYPSPEFLTVGEFEQYPDCRVSRNLYIDEGSAMFPDSEYILRHRHVIKAVTFSC